MIKVDVSVRELSLACRLPNRFLAGFVAALTQSSTVLVSQIHFEALWSLIDELQADEIREQILFDSFGVVGEGVGLSVSGGIDGAIEVFAKNITKIETRKLAWLPPPILDRVLSLAPRASEDEFARLILKLICDHNKPRSLLRRVKFSELAVGTIGDISDVLGDLTDFADQLLERARFPLARKYRVLHVKPNSTPTVDFRGFQDAFSESHYVLEFRQMTANAFLGELRVQKNFMKKFDVVFIGGQDGVPAEFHSIPMSTIEEFFVPFRREGGALLFFHDTVHPGNAIWDHYSKVLGLTSGGLPVSARIVGVANSPVLRRPFRFDGPIPVSSTHTSQRPTSLRSVILWSEGLNESNFYYMENAGIGVVQMGHSLGIQRDEWRLLVNIVCHLVGF